MTGESAHILAREGNLAVTHLPGRAHPGIHIQGDTFLELHRQLTAAAARVHDAPAELEVAIAELTAIRTFYEERWRC
ncbi:DUF6959 family protein [Actinoplanes sp. NPDC048988]|uniref:DUF6959 family protein n=1 Tax=Actinoplanes sp. NPDC048988 TaxID=3363901 RepID=UPI0037117357